MKKGILLLSMLMLVTLSLQAQTSEHYIEVTGTSEIEIMPDKIHYIIEIREYFKEEFEEWAKPEEYRTKVDRKSTRLNSSHNRESRMPSSA